MSRGSERESDPRQRPRSEPETRDEEVIRLREGAEEDAHKLEALRGAHDQDAARIHQLAEEAVESDRIERAQQALIDELRRGWPCGAQRGVDRGALVGGRA